MTIGDYRQFQLAVTSGGQPVDLTDVEELSFVLQTVGGVEVARWPLGGGVVVSSPATAGIAVLTVTPAMLAWASGYQSLKYTWSYVDGNGNPTLALEQGTFALIPPP
jgi:hypothetical protein